LPGLIDELAEHGPWALKDPRLCLLFPIWRAALEQRGLRPRVVLCLREPDEVVASLAARDGLAGALASQLWCTHVLTAERLTRDLDRNVVRYGDLVNRATVLDELSEWAGVTEPDRVQAARSSVRPELHRQRGVEGDAATDALTRRVALALRGAIDTHELDAASRELGAAIDVLGPGIDAHHALVRHWQVAFEEASDQLDTSRQALERQIDLIRDQDEGLRRAVEASAGFVEAVRQIEVHRLNAEQMSRELGAARALIAERDRVLALESGAPRRVAPDVQIDSAAALTYDGRIDLRVENNAHSRAVRYLLETPTRGRRVLEVGCASGYFGAALRALGYEVWGVEADPAAAAIAAHRLDRVWHGGVEALLAALDPVETGFDFMVFGDVLEHLVDPAAVLRACVAHLAPGGRIVASVPNVAHGSVRLMLLEGRWDYSDTGILDATHLHFYTRDSLVDLFTQADLAIERLSGVTLDSELAGIAFDPRFSDAFARLITDRERDVFQFVVMAAPGETVGVAAGNRRFMVRGGYRILCLPPAPDSTLATIRLADPLERLAQRYGGELRFGSLVAPDPEDVAWCDTVVLQREASPYIVDLAARLRAVGKRVVLDIDDFLLDVPAYLSVHEHCRAMRPHLETLLAGVDAVSASTEPLRAALLPYNPNTFVTPNHAWTSHPPIVHDAAETGGVVRVLVASSDTVRVDFLVDVLATLISEHAVELVAIGPPGEFLRHAGLPVDVLPNVPHDQFKALIASRANAIALVPLDDTPFNRCKSAVKYFDYALAGVPVVASGIEPYATVITDGKDGLLCPDNRDRWLAAATALVTDAGLRREIAARARALCLARHDLDRAAAAWQGLLVATAPALGQGGTLRAIAPRSGWQPVRGTSRHVAQPTSWRSVWRMYREGGIRGLVERWKTVF
jgi:2-polyprenyl-3-methyl-5-hydroxy-6-metoxy-1,4-benzoquinol methylase